MRGKFQIYLPIESPKIFFCGVLPVVMDRPLAVEETVRVLTHVCAMKPAMKQPMQR